MSYILDALKRAEAERRPDATDTLVLPASSPPEAGATTRKTTAWMAGMAVMLAVGGLLLLQMRANVPAALPSASAPVQQPEAIAAQKIGKNNETPIASAAPVTPKSAPVAVIIPPDSPPTRPAERARPVPAPAPKPAPVPTLRELPEQVQRNIPPLAVGGYLYSPKPADRTVLINGQLLQEGDVVLPGLTLEQLLPDGMVLNFRGHRYRSPY